MAHQTEIVVNGQTVEVTEFDHTAQEIDDGIDKVNTLTGEDIPTSDTDSTSISSQLSNKPANCTLNAGVNLDLITHSGMYRINTPTNGPSFDFGQLVVSGMLGGNTAAQIAFSHDGAQVEFRCGAALTTTPVWSEWVSLSTATPPTVRDLTLQAGFENIGTCMFWKTQEGTVTISGGVSGKMLAETDTQIGTLIAGYFPPRSYRRNAVTNTGSAYIEIRADGTVWAHPYTAADRCFFDADFVAAGGDA